MEQQVLLLPVAGDTERAGIDALAVVATREQLEAWLASIQQIRTAHGANPAFQYAAFSADPPPLFLTASEVDRVWPDIAGWADDDVSTFAADDVPALTPQPIAYATLLVSTSGIAWQGVPKHTSVPVTLETASVDAEFLQDLLRDLAPKKA